MLNNQINIIPDFTFENKFYLENIFDDKLEIRRRKKVIINFKQIYQSEADRMSDLKAFIRGILIRYPNSIRMICINEKIIDVNIYKEVCAMSRNYNFILDNSDDNPLNEIIFDVDLDK